MSTSDSSSSSSSSCKVFDSNTVASHASRDDTWVVINNKVYDVSKFLDEHPGGEEAILELAGKDATEAFEDVGHSDSARDLLKTFYIGDLKQSEEVKPEELKKAPTITPSINPSPEVSAPPATSSSNSMFLPLLILAIAYFLYRFYYSS